MLELFVFLIPSVAKMSKPLTSFAKLQMLLRNKRVQVWNEVVAPKWGVCVERGLSPSSCMLYRSVCGNYSGNLLQTDFLCIDCTACQRWSRAVARGCGCTPSVAAPRPAPLTTAFM